MFRLFIAKLHPALRSQLFSTTSVSSITANLVLVSGLLCTKELWRKVFPVDHSRIHHATAIGADIQTIAQENIAAIPKHFKSFSLVTHSMGGWVGCEMAKLATTQRVDRIVMINGALHSPTNAEILYKLNVVKKFSGYTPSDFEKVLTPEFFAKQFHHLSENDIAVLIKMAKEVGVNNFLDQIRATLTRGNPLRVLKELVELEIPIQIVSGMNDKVFGTGSRNELLVEKNTLVEHIELSDCGHLAPLEKAVEVRQIIAGGSPSYQAKSAREWNRL